jgi:hypothetical protein
MKNNVKEISINEIQLSVRRTWGNCKPMTKVFKSKRDYNRKDKSWMKED